MSIEIGYAQLRLSWLPVTEDRIEPALPSVDDFLRPLNGSIRLLGCRYNEAMLTETGVIRKGGWKTATGKWECTSNVAWVEGEKYALDFCLTFRHTDGEAASAGVAVAFDFSSWNPENYVLIPASVYNGNRNRVVNRQYNTGFDEADYYRKDLPMTTVPLPQLSPEPGALSRLEINTSYTTTPAICFFDNEKKRGFILLTGQGMEKDGKIIDHGLAIEESADRRNATLVVSAPGVPDKKPEFIGFSPSPYRGIDWKQDDELTLRIQLYVFEAENIPALLEKFMTVRKAVTGENTLRNLMPFSEISRVMSQRIDKRYHHGKLADYYWDHNKTFVKPGWTGGLMSTFPMLAIDDEYHRNRVASTFDFALPRLQEHTGYYYGMLDEDGRVYGFASTHNKPEIVLTRRNADILYWMLKQFMLLKAQGHTVPPVWEENIKRLADAFVTTWKENRQWGNYINIKTGEIAIYHTTGGIIAIGGLALASAYWRHPDYLEVAKDAAEYYFQEYFVKLGMTNGGCGDILQNAEYETTMGFMMSLMALYEMTDNKKWLEKSRQLANLCATWTVSYDYRLPTHTTFAKWNTQLTGAVWASTQNKHAAPGFCTVSGDPLFKIYRATGDERYARLMYDVVHAWAEGLQPNGNITERLTYCDADNKGEPGWDYSDNWCELNGLLMAVELPGIYIRTDIDRMFVFDHVEAKVLKRDKTSVALQIKNPTAYDASVSVFAENKEMASKPSGDTAFLNWPKIEVKAGETKTWTIYPVF